MSAVSMNIRLKDAMKEAMRNKDKARLSVIRMAMAEFKRIEVDERIEVDDARALVLLDKMVKQRRESITQYTQAGRTELADTEQFEISVLQEFLPQPLTDEEISQIIAAAISESGASSMKDMGKVMGLIKPQIQGRADMGAVSKQLKSQLG